MRSVAGGLLQDDQVVEDCVADYFEAKATFEVATLDVAQSNRAVAQVHKLVLLSDGILKDNMFARQLARKYG